MNETTDNSSSNPRMAQAAARPSACWLCRGPVEGGALFCPTCKAVQPPAALDHFARLGIPVGFDIDDAELDRRYFGFQRQLHPDRFASRTARERAISQSQAVALNEAHETLKDPLARAIYLLTLKGAITEAESHTISEPSLLMEQMERREALAAIGTAAAAQAFLAEAGRDLQASIAAIGAAFRDRDLDTAKRETTRLKYLTKLVEEARLKRARLGETRTAAAKAL